MHVLKTRCENGHVFSVRRPKNSTLIPKIISSILCIICHPEQSDKVCGGCRLPFSIVGKHSKSLCEACFWKDWKYKKKTL